MRILRSATSAACILAIAGLTAAPAAASGDPEDDVVRDLAIDITVDDDGVLHVEETYEWDFGEREGLGFFRSLTTERLTDEGRRQYDYEGFTLTSPTGAPAEIVDTDQSRDSLELTLGAPDDSDQTSTGVQTYQLSYTVHGAADPDGLDWITAGPDADVPMDRVTAEVDLPAEASDAACWQGEDSDLGDGVGCEVSSDGTSVTVTAANLPPGGWQAVELAVPEGTFADAEPVYAEPTAAEEIAERITPQTDRMWEAVTSYWWAFAALGLGLAGALLTWRLRQGTDEHFTSLPQGSLPGAGAPQDSARLDQQPQVIPRGVIPDGLTPYEAALLWHKTPHVPHADFITLTVTDLAARGYLSIEESVQENDEEDDDAAADWLLTQSMTDTSALMRWERDVVEALFHDRETARVSDLDEDFNQAARTAQKAALDGFNDRGLLARRVGGIGSPWAWFGGALLALVLISPVISFGTDMPHSLSYLLLGAAGTCAVLGMIWLGTVRASNHRTAAGRAHYEQLRGLQATQSVTLGASEDTDLSPRDISRQLPYAVAFGERERWSQLMDARADTESLPGMHAGSWVVMTAGMSNTVGASHHGSGSASAGGSTGGFSAGSFGGGGGVAGR